LEQRFETPYLDPSAIRITTGLGHGTTATQIRRFNEVRQDVRGRSWLDFESSESFQDLVNRCAAEYSQHIDQALMDSVVYGRGTVSVSVTPEEYERRNNHWTVHGPAVWRAPREGVYSITSDVRRIDNTRLRANRMYMMREGREIPLQEGTHEIVWVHIESEGRPEPRVRANVLNGLWANFDDDVLVRTEPRLNLIDLTHHTASAIVRDMHSAGRREDVMYFTLDSVRRLFGNANLQEQGFQYLSGAKFYILGINLEQSYVRMGVELR
jgi:hypothetical protein